MHNLDSRGPRVNGERVYDYQIPLIYAVFNWCTDSQGNRLIDSIGADIIAKWLGLVNQKVSSLRDAYQMRSWHNLESTLSREAAEIANPHRQFFGRKAAYLQIAYEKDELKMPDQSATELQEYVRIVSGLPLRPQDATGQ